MAALTIISSGHTPKVVEFAGAASLNALFAQAGLPAPADGTLKEDGVRPLRGTDEITRSLTVYYDAAVKGAWKIWRKHG